MPFDRRDGIVLAVLAAYFAVQAALRIALGGALEVDEAEMIVIARDWQLGYGPQLPLYTWVQVAAFKLFGFGTAGLALPKNLILWLAAAGLYIGLRRVLPMQVALAGMLSLALLPNVIWEFQRASTHSIALLAATTWTIAAFLALQHSDRRSNWIILGVVMGLGGLCKANYWLVPLSLGLVAALEARRAGNRLRMDGLAMAMATALAIVAVPYGWALLNPAQTFASAAKFYRADSAMPPGLEGLFEAISGSLAGLLLIFVAAGLLFLFGRRSANDDHSPMPGLLVKAGIVVLAVSCLAILFGRVSEVQSRWLVPAYVMIGAGVMADAAQRATPRALRWLAGATVVLAAVTIAGMAELRANGRTTGRIDFEPLANLADRLKPDVVIADYQFSGNLRLLRPDLEVRTAQMPANPAETRVMEVVIPDAEGTLPRNGSVLEAGRIDLPYLNGAVPAFPLIWRLSE